MNGFGGRGGAYFVVCSKNVIRVVLVTGAVLSVPLVAMQVSAGTDWGLEDFALAAGLLFGAGMTYQFVAGKSGHVHYRVAVGLAVAAGSVLVMANLAVGIIGAEDNPTNLMYFGVPAIGIGGAAMARFRPRGMARTLVAMAIAQALVTATGMVLWLPHGITTRGIELVIGANAFLVLMFLGSAVLFHSAGAADLKSGQGLE